MERSKIFRNALTLVLAVLPTFTLTSCLTVFSGSRQAVTFLGEDGTKLYDGTTMVKLAEITAGNRPSPASKRRPGKRW